MADKFAAKTGAKPFKGAEGLKRPKSAVIAVVQDDESQFTPNAHSKKK